MKDDESDLLLYEIELKKENILGRSRNVVLILTLAQLLCYTIVNLLGTKRIIYKKKI